MTHVHEHRRQGAMSGEAPSVWGLGLLDVLPVALLAAPVLMDAWWSAPGTRQADLWTYLLVTVSLLALLVRRRWPLPVAVVCTATFTGLTLLGHSGELLPAPTLLALYEVAARGERRRTAWVAVLACSLFWVLGLASVDPLGAAGGTPMIELLLPLVPLSLGEASRSHRESLAATRSAHEAETASRLAEERAQLAREVHDVVGHTLAGVTVQLAAAQTAFDLDQPEKARVAVARARTNATKAMALLRSTVEGLRTNPTTPPVPDLAGVAELVAPLRDAGLAVEVVNGVPSGAALPPAVSLVGYRVVQEAITNIARHSGARRAWLSVELREDHLEIRVEDDGDSGVGAPGAGFGLSGMRERVQAAGGTVETGPRAGGGFRVRAVLPLHGLSQPGLPLSGAAGATEGRAR